MEVRVQRVVREASAESYLPTSSSDSLSHHGIKGQKWGVRRFQNADGTLTKAGRTRYGYSNLEKSKDLYERSKSNVESMYKFGGEHVIRHVPEIDEAGVYLNDKSIKVACNFEDYSDSLASAIKDCAQDKDLKSEIFKRLDKDFNGPDDVDDKEYLDLVAEEYIDELAIPKAQKSVKKEFDTYKKSLDDYYSDLSTITKELVGTYGDTPISSTTKTTKVGEKGIFKKPVYKNELITESYSEVVENTLAYLGSATYMHYLFNHEEMAYLDGPGADAKDELKKQIISEWEDRYG